MNSPVVTQISECFIKPQHISNESKQPVYLSSWDIRMLALHYEQTGFLFRKNLNEPINSLLSKLKSSLSKTLNHFYTLAGQLSTIKKQNPDSCSVFIDCQKGSGARFVHTTINVTVEDIVSPKDVPLIVHSFFDHDRVVNHDGHFRPLLTIQVNELLDGVFLGCSINHAVVDGTSLWHFMNSWSEIFQSEKTEISRKPIHDHWFPNGYGPIINLPFSFSDEKQFTSRYESPILRERFFHFSKESLYDLKNRANMESKSDQNYKISSFQALSALLWRCITRARFLPYDQVTSCRLAANNRSRMEPKISENYFGNCIQGVRGIAKCGELLEHNLGWAALKLNEAVLNHTNESIRDFEDEWHKSPFFLQRIFDPCNIMMANSPRFDMYGNDFGLGKALCLRSGHSNKFCGKVISYPGSEGDGSVDLEVCLGPQVMSVFESDPEFMDYATEQRV